MTNENGLSKVVPTAIVQVPQGDEEFVADQRPPENPLLRLHILLYGRYHLAIMLGLVLAAGAATAAWIFIPPKAEIVGIVRIQPYVGKILYNNDENGLLPSFDTFVDFQESLLQSVRVSEAAAQRPAWVALHRKWTGLGPSLVKTDDLVVDHVKGSELITITATDRDEAAASAAIQSILEAYNAISADDEKTATSDKVKKLEDYRSNQASQVNGIHQQIQKINDEYGVDDVADLYRAKVQEADRWDAEIQRIDSELALAAPAQGGPATTEPSTQPVVAEITREDVAAVNSEMKGYIDQEDRLSLELIRLRSRLGKNNTELTAAEEALESVQERIAVILRHYQEKSAVSGITPLPGRERGQLTVADLQAQKARFEKLFATAHASALDLGRKNFQLRDLKRDEAAASKRLDAATEAGDSRTLEAASNSRISILSYGEKPNTPLKSKRAPVTAAAGIGGLGAGFALVALLGFIDRRVRSVLHVQQLEPNVRILGVLPILSDDLADAGQKTEAAHCVHQIRNLLDNGNFDTGRVLGITSPNAGDGKTSLTLALGLSFAAAGSRTLIIDCDVIGAGLTSRLNAVVHRNISSILKRDGVVTEAQLNEARQSARATQRKVVEVLLDLGYVTEADVAQAQAAAALTSVGLLDAFDGEPVAACITPVLAKNLFVLPLGQAEAHHTTQISAKAMRRVLNDARKLFDVVIVDTGPILGSLEASILVREVDEVVLAVARDGRASVVTHTIKRLESLGVRIAGLVFNRAMPGDVAFATYGSSASTASTRSNQVVRGSHDTSSRQLRLGSLVAAVVNSPDDESTKETQDS